MYIIFYEWGNIAAPSLEQLKFPKWICFSPEIGVISGKSKPE